MEPTTFGALLKRSRMAAGLTQEALAERANLSTRAVSDLESGRLDGRPAHELSTPAGAGHEPGALAPAC
jgi:transcriptional regulator with XRE-family HTH domain